MGITDDIRLRTGTLFDDDCAKEAIHIPGGIQPHGFLFSIDVAGAIVQYSANSTALLGTASPTLSGMPIATVIGDRLALEILQILPSLEDGVPRYVGTMPDPRDDAVLFGLSVHRNGSTFIIELEVATSNKDVLSSVYPLVEAFLTGLRTAQTVTQLGQLVVQQVQKITGFGRTMVYRFDDHGHGHVFAESVIDGYSAYLNQRFPASDIPAQARELYKKNRVRLIADVDYQPSPLIPALHPVTGEPTDLTFASLRSVSPVHLQYMRNMQTDASMSMSIVVDNKLWGLISCHHTTPRFPSFESRTACAQIAQVLSLQIEAKESQAADKYQLALRQILAALLASMANTESFVDGLAGDASHLLAVTASSGAAIVFEGRINTLGVTPNVEDIEKIVAWLDAQHEELYAIDDVGRFFPELSENSECAGFLAVSVSRIYRNYVIWFRPEVVRTIEWAGNPYAKTDDNPLTPRQSFERWMDVVRGKSLAWLPSEIEIAREFRTALLSIILRRAEAMAQLALELTRANQDLEEFSYSVSHDLRAPLRHIAGFGDLMKRMSDEELHSPRARNYIDRIVAAARLGGKLVDNLLAFAQMGRAALHPQQVDVRAAVVLLVKSGLVGKGAERVDWQIRDMVPVEADLAFVQIVLSNLLRNAVKFSSPRELPTIEIGSYAGTDDLSGQEVFYVKDNGVGFDMRYVSKLFGVFQRLHAEEAFEGTGIGLASVHRIVERHGGRVWADSKEGEGATFFFSLPRHFRTDNNTRQETPQAAIARLAATGELTTMVGSQTEQKQRS